MTGTCYYVDALFPSFVLQIHKKVFNSVRQASVTQSVTNNAPVTLE